MLQRRYEWNAETCEAIAWDTHYFHPFLLERGNLPFSWGRNDCAAFSADGIQAITGTDVMAELRGYSTEAEAMQRIADVTGGTSLEDAVVWIAAKHGFAERTHILMAQRGDLVLYRNADILACGLVHLNGRDIVSPGTKGIIRMPLTSAYRVWTY